MKQSGGYIWVYSEPGHGTTLRGLSAARGAATRRRRRTSRTPSDRRGARVGDGAARRGRRRGARARPRCCAATATWCSRRATASTRCAWPSGTPDDIHLMVTDVVMPHMSGRDLAERLCDGRPKMKVLFMSGYTDHAIMHRDLTPGSAFIQKPFTPETFARKVRNGPRRRNGRQLSCGGTPLAYQSAAARRLPRLPSLIHDRRHLDIDRCPIRCVNPAPPSADRGRADRS